MKEKRKGRKKVGRSLVERVGDEKRGKKNKRVRAGPNNVLREKNA